MTVRDLAIKALQENEGDWKAAAESLIQDLRRKPKLKAEFLEKYVESGVWSEIRFAARTIRMDFWSAGIDPGEDDPDGLERVGRRNIESLLDYPLTGGLPLGMGTIKLLEDMVETHEFHSKRNAVKARWFRLIIKNMGDHAYVKDAFDHETLRELQREAEVYV